MSQIQKLYKKFNSDDISLEAFSILLRVYRRERNPYFVYEFYPVVREYSLDKVRPVFEFFIKEGVVRKEKVEKPLPKSQNCFKPKRGQIKTFCLDCCKSFVRSDLGVCSHCGSSKVAKISQKVKVPRSSKRMKKFVAAFRQVGSEWVLKDYSKIGW